MPYQSMAFPTEKALKLKQYNSLLQKNNQLNISNCIQKTNKQEVRQSSMLYQVLFVSFLLALVGGIDYDIWEPVIHIEIDKDQYGYNPDQMYAREYVENNREEIERKMKSHNLGRHDMS